MASTPITSTVIAIDIRRGALHYYSMLGNDRTSIVHQVKNFAGAAFTDEFYQKFKDAVAGFVADHPFEGVRKITVIVPDEAVATDTIRLPLLRSPRLQQNAVNVKIGDIFSNRDNLKVTTHLSEKNKQYCSFSVAAIRKDIIQSLSTACGENKLFVDCLSYSSASVAAALTALTPKSKNDSYLFLDIKDIYSRFIFVSGGRALGFYTLPFGLEYLGEPRFIQEDMLFDHSLAEITVLNAREKAKNKKLTLLRELSDSDTPIEGQTDSTAAQTVNLDAMLSLNAGIVDSDDPEDNFEDPAAEPEQSVETDSAEETQTDPVAPTKPNAAKVKILAKKTPRRLPQFMQRPVPETEEDIVKEKFRAFVKWGLTVLAGNPNITSIGAPKYVSVNLPSEYQYIFDALSEEESENGIPFVRFTVADGDEDLATHLELFGGLNTKIWHSSMKF